MRGRRDVIISIPCGETECENCDYFVIHVGSPVWCSAFHTILKTTETERLRCDLCLDAEAQLRDLYDYKAIAIRAVSHE